MDGGSIPPSQTHRAPALRIDRRGRGMSNDWRNHWRKSRWVTIADFPLLSLDINPATYEGGHPDAGCRGNDLLKQAFASDDERVGIKLRMRTQPGNPQHKARHLLRLACRPGEYQPDEMDREVFLQDAIAFAVSEGWEVPDWLHDLSAVPFRSGTNELAQAKARIADLEAEIERLKSMSQDVSAWKEDASEAPSPKKPTLRDNSLIATIAALLAAWPGRAIPSGKDLEKTAHSLGLILSDDTIRKALTAAQAAAPSLPLPK